MPPPGRRPEAAAPLPLRFTGIQCRFGALQSIVIGCDK